MCGNPIYESKTPRAQGAQRQKRNMGIDKRASSPRHCFIRKSIFEPKWGQLPGSKISIDWKNVPEELYFSILFYDLDSMEENSGGYTESIGGRLGRREKTRRGNLWDWIKSKVERHRLPLQRWAKHTETVCGKQITMLHLVLWCPGLCLEQDRPPGPTFS